MTRNKFSITQAVFLVISIAFMAVVLFCFGTVLILIKNIDIKISGYALSILGFMILVLAMSAVSFFSSCFFNLSRNSLIVGIAVPMTFYLFGLLGMIEGYAFIKNFKYLTIVTLFDVHGAVALSAKIIWKFGILFAIALIGYVGGILYFKKKDLPL